MSDLHDMHANARDSAAILEASNERFRLLVESVTEYVIYMLDSTGHIVSWNPGVQRIKGYSEDELLGRHFSLFFPPEDIKRGKPEAILKTAAEHGTYQEEGWRVRKDGSLFWASVLITALYDQQGQLRGFGKVTRDMTERKLAEEQREQLREREYQLEREREARAQIETAMRMRDTFLSILAHELRTPLTTILGNAQLMLRRTQREGSLSERDQRSLQVIVDQATRFNRLVHLQLDMSRLESGQLQIERRPVDVAALARRVVEEGEESAIATTTHRVVYTGPHAPVVVQGDELRLEQVLQNLIQNAIKYSPIGGMVHVQLEQHDTRVGISIQDEGIGIPQKDVPQLFQRFYRASNVSRHQISGLGIGLYIIKELVTLHGGRVEVASEEDRGSTFTVWLPLAQDAGTITQE